MVTIDQIIRERELSPRIKRHMHYEAGTLHVSWASINKLRNKDPLLYKDALEALLILKVLSKRLGYNYDVQSGDLSRNPRKNRGLLYFTSERHAQDFLASLGPDPTRFTIRHYGHSQV